MVVTSCEECMLLGGDGKEGAVGNGQQGVEVQQRHGEDRTRQRRKGSLRVGVLELALGEAGGGEPKLLPRRVIRASVAALGVDVINLRCEGEARQCRKGEHSDLGAACRPLMLVIAELTILGDKQAHEVGEALVNVVADHANTRLRPLLDEGHDVPAAAAGQQSSPSRRRWLGSSHVEHSPDTLPLRLVRSGNLAGSQQTPLLCAVEVELERMSRGSVALGEEGGEDGE